MVELFKEFVSPVVFIEKQLHWLHREIVIYKYQKGIRHCITDCARSGGGGGVSAQVY